MIPARVALERLCDGNRRFVSESPDILASQTPQSELAEGQEPFAITLGCSDARVPAEIIFDHGLGGLFVIRVAGNIVALKSAVSSSPLSPSARGWSWFLASPGAGPVWPPSTS